MTRHGPHQGAQKSTTTGLSDWMTSSSKVASVTSLTLLIASLYLQRLLSEPPSQRRQAKGRHLHEGLEHDRAGHLRAAELAVGEDDRHLVDAVPGAQGPVRRLDLKGVAARGDRLGDECL